MTSQKCEYAQSVDLDFLYSSQSMRDAFQLYANLLRHLKIFNKLFDLDNDTAFVF